MKALLSTLVVVPAMALDAGKPRVVVGADGAASIRRSSGAISGNLRLYLHGPDWEQIHMTDAPTRSEKAGNGWRESSGALPIPRGDGAFARYTLRHQALPNALSVGLKLAFPRAAELNACSLSLFWNTKLLTGRSISVTDAGGETAQVATPDSFAELHLWDGTARQVRLPGPQPLTVRIDPPAALLVQDNRQFGLQHLEFRFNYVQGDQVATGETAEGQYTFVFDDPTEIVLDDTTEAVPSVTAKWVTWSCPWDGTATDVSYLNDKPAGKHGFLQVADDEFVFEDGTPVRFWGVNLCGGAAFPDTAHAPKIAERLARGGVNLVRIHHADAKSAEHGLIDYERGDSQHLDRESLERFDLFMAELRKQGIYVCLELLSARTFLPADGVDNAEELGPGAKPYALLDRRLIDLQQTLYRRLWRHVNPHTGLALKIDPQIAMVELVNESDALTFDVALEPYRTRLELSLRRWNAQNGGDLPAGAVDLAARPPAVVRFLTHMNERYCNDMTSFLQGTVGLRVPIGFTVGATNPALLPIAQLAEFSSAHGLHDRPTDGNRRFRNTLMAARRSNLFAEYASQRLRGKPMVVGEWGQPWPNDWRAELPLAAAAVGAFQKWAGLSLFAYRHSAEPAEHIQGPFEAGLDPACFGLFPHAALLFRRDVAAARQTVTVPIGLHASPDTLTTGSRPPLPAFEATPEQHRVQVSLGGVAQGETRAPPDQPVVPADATEVTSDTGELWRSWQQRFGTIDTAGTQAAYGLLGGKGEIRLKDVALTVDTPFAVVAVSSLTYLPVARSNRLLLTAVGRVENTGTKLNVSRNVRLEDGASPVLLETIVGRVALHSGVAGLRVTALGPTGDSLQEIPSVQEDGILEFAIGTPPLTMHYLISRR